MAAPQEQWQHKVHHFVVILGHLLFSAVKNQGDKSVYICVFKCVRVCSLMDL